MITVKTKRHNRLSVMSFVLKYQDVLMKAKLQFYL